MILRIVTGLLVCVCTISCLKQKPDPADSDIFFPSKRLGELRDKKLEEVSGLASSVANPGLLWAQTDSGNPAAVYLVDETLKVRLTCKLKGVKNRDWEDIAVGPGPEEGKRYVYVADIGDNNASYAFKYIYRFEEPLLTADRSEITIDSFDTITFRLEDGKKDTESIFVHPKTNDIYVVSKRERPVYLYCLKYPLAGDTVAAEKMTSLPLTQIVSAAISPGGDEILMKNYDNIYYWQMNGRTVPDALKEKPSILKYTEEPQGEAIAFNLDGSGFYTLSEKIIGEKTFLYFYRKKPR